MESRYCLISRFIYYNDKHQFTTNACGTWLRSKLQWGSQARLRSPGQHMQSVLRLENKTAGWSFLLQHQNRCLLFLLATRGQSHSSQSHSTITSWVSTSFSSSPHSRHELTAHCCNIQLQPHLISYLHAFYIPSFQGLGDSQGHTGQGYQSCITFSVIFSLAKLV